MKNANLKKRKSRIKKLLLLLFQRSQGFFDFAVEFRAPGWRGWRVWGKVANAEIHRSKDYGDVFDAGFRCNDEEVFSSLISHGEAPNGCSPAMDHDIAAEIGSAIAVAVLFVEVVWIIDAKSEMETAVGIEGFDLVQAFGHLAITLLQFWT